MNISERVKHIVNLDFYKNINLPEEVVSLGLLPPQHELYILRCPIKIPNQPLKIPYELKWCYPLFVRSLLYQSSINKDIQFVYLTVRHGPVISKTDDEWHVDGFSMKISHLPEQNYIWVDKYPTEYVEHGIEIPEDFDPLVNNLHYYIQDNLPSDINVKTLKEKTLYAMDPYVIHRRPKVAKEVSRTFVRLSFTAIPIDDKNNYINPAYGNICSDYDGVIDFRDKLVRY